MMDKELQVRLDMMENKLGSQIENVVKEFKVLNGTVQEHTNILAVMTERERVRQSITRVSWAAFVAAVAAFLAVAGNVIVGAVK